MMAQRWRVYHADLPRRRGALVRLGPEESHHAWNVLRRRPGGRLAVFDGAGHEWEGVIQEGEARGLVVRLEDVVTGPVEPRIEIVLFQGTCRPERMELVIQKATEIGVTAIRPLSAERSRIGPPSPARLARWKRIVVESCKQCGRRSLPGIEPAADLPAPPAGREALLLDEEPGAPPIGQALRGPAPRGVWLAVGPEGGFSPGEIELWTGRGWKRTGLGPRTLRTETAGLVAAAIVLHRWGDVGPDAPAGGSV